MNIQRQINANTVLHYLEANNWHHSDDDQVIIDVFTLSFSFYDCHYFVYVTKADLLDDCGCGITMEGDSKLFDSFESAIEDDHWELIKKKCRQYEMWYNRFMN